jgi:hypothetical protein
MWGNVLYDASERGDVMEVERLLDSGTDVNGENYVWNILHYVILYILLLYIIVVCGADTSPCCQSAGPCSSM